MSGARVEAALLILKNLSDQTRVEITFCSNEERKKFATASLLNKLLEFFFFVCGFVASHESTLV